MFNTHIFHSKKRNNEAGNAVIMVLVVLVVVAVGALAYLSGQMAGEQDSPSMVTASSAEATEQTQQAPAAGDTGQAQETILKPGNPTVAKVGSNEIKRVDVFNYIQTLPPNARQLPIGQLFPAAMEQVINNSVINDKTKNVNLDKDPEVKKQLAAAKENIVRTVYIQNQITARLTDARLKEGYEAYKAGFKQVEEVKARHILVKEKSEAEKIISDLEKGGEFAELAKENSTDGTAASGGDLGYFVQADVVPAFSDVAFATEVGSFTKKPVETEFGFHVIKVEDKRMRQPAEYDDAKPFLETQLRRIALDEIISEWRDSSEIKRFDINGDEIEPAAGEETPATN